MSSIFSRKDGESTPGSPSLTRVSPQGAQLPDAPLAWPIPVAGFLAAASTVLLSLLVLAVVFSIGWITTADPNSEYVSSLHAAVATWLLSQGVPISTAGLQFSLIPLLLTFMFLRFHVNSVKRALSSAIIVNIAGVLGLIATYVASYAAFGLLGTLLVGDDVSANASRAIIGTGLTAIVASIWAVTRAKGSIVATQKRTFTNSSERTQTRIKARSAHELAMESWLQLPMWVRDSFAVALRSTLFVLVLTTVATFVLVGFRFNEINAVIHMTANSGTSIAVVTLISSAFLPTVIGWVFAIISGPGIALGAGSSFTLMSQVSGAMPAVAFFAVIPTQLPQYSAVIAVIPMLATFIYAQVWFGPDRVRSESLVGWLPQVILTALLTAVLAGLIGYAVSGSFGGGRFAAIGPDLLMLMLVTAGWSVLGSSARIGFYLLRHMRK
ncbi:MAG: hypothetical protein RIS75_1448 [Actinomycetota bacterium]